MSIAEATVILTPVHRAADALPYHGTVDVIDDVRDLWTIRDAWRSLSCDDHALGMRFDWCRTWLDVFGDTTQPCIIVLRGPDDRIDAIAPMVIDVVSIGPFRLRIARHIGSTFAPQPSGWLTRPELAPALCAAMMMQCLDVERCDAVSIGPVAAHGVEAMAVRQFASQRGQDLCLAHDRPAGDLLHLDLPASMDDYQGSLSRNQRQNLRKAWRRAREHAALTLEWQDADPKALDTFIAMHGRQWRSAGRLGHFDDWPGARAFHHLLAERMAGSGRLRRLELSLDDRIVGQQYAVHTGTRWTSLLSARVTNPRVAPLDIGRLTLAASIERAIRDGATMMDLGIGTYGYKRRLGATATPMRRLLVTSTRPAAAARSLAFRGIADLFDRLYYRGWICRAAPNLNRRRHPLSTTWIRSRL